METQSKGVESESESVHVEAKVTRLASCDVNDVQGCEYSKLEGFET